MANFRCKIYAALFVCCISTLGVTAQENLKRAIKAFTEQKDGIQFNNSLSETKDPVTGRLVSQKNIYNFKIGDTNEGLFNNPTSKNAKCKKLLDDICDAFEKDKSVGYDFMSVDAAAEERVPKIIACSENPSENPNDAIIINDQQGYYTIMMNVIDRGNPAYRYNYTLEWSQPGVESSIEKQISGRILVIYCKKPEQNAQQSENPKVDLLTKFNVMKNKYKGNDETLSSTIAASMVELCKNNARLLNKDEKKLCISSLQEMQKKTKDKFQKGLLEEAMNYLK